MIDIHSHVLPGVDDGAGTLEESLEMLNLAAASGTTDIVATPHSNAEFAFDDGRIEEVFRELSSKSEGLINLHLGCDFHLSYENVHDALRNPEKYTINHRQYLMVELPDLVSLSATREVLRQLLEAQIIPIITHPERNLSLQARLRELDQWVRDGCLLQVTGQSFLGRFGPQAKRAADSLMNANLVHFVASDAHDCVDRTPDLSAAYKYISSRYGTGRADAAFIYNPTATVCGESLSQIEVGSSKISRLLKFWK